MKQNKSTSTIKEFYGAANTYNGFYSLFGSIFSPEKLKKIYILKGGPGCGKSTAIRKVSEYAQDAGYDVENYYCSSSPSSFDGVIIPALSTAVVDGTAPHTVDPKYPAVCENIINLGEAWDTEKSKAMNSEIRELGVEKAAAYKRAYAYLSSCMSAKEVIMNCLSSYIIEDKLSKAVDRICSKIKAVKSCGYITEVFTDCICGSGNVHLDTFERLSETRYFIKDYADIAPVFFDYLASSLSDSDVDITVALDPLSPGQYSGIWIPQCKTSFTMYDDNFCLSLDKKQLPYKIINTARFCDTNQFKRNKVFYKYADKSEKILMNGAIKQLSLAASLHDEMEKYYFGITDFVMVEEMTNRLIEKIF